jgi:Site-specific recombinase XerD
MQCSESDRREQRRVKRISARLGKSNIKRKWLDRYQQHLERVLGLSSATQERYLLHAARLLKTLPANETINFSTLTSDRIVHFLQQDAEGRKGASSRVTVTALRSFLRFLVSQGLIVNGLETVIPVRRCHPRGTPECLTENEVESLIDHVHDQTDKGKRNYAILLLLVRLGLRAKEVIGLRLDDIDWTGGTILVRGKSGRERILPLQTDVGKAVLSYLHIRPKTKYREVFLRHKAPVRPFQTHTAVSLLVRTLIADAGIQRQRSGSHLLRHTFATRMVNSGSSFFDVADLLGHQSLSTTAVYAKLDFTSLVQVALPWPGGE